MKKLLAVMLVLAVTACSDKSSDAYIRDRVVKLTNGRGSCSGIQVQAPSKRIYILTAAHCEVLIGKDNMVTAIDEYGNKKQVQFIAEDSVSDLMILSAMNDNYVEIAEKTLPHEKVHAITHGRGMPSYRTDGEIVMEESIMVGIWEIDDQEKMIKCLSSPKYKPVMTLFSMLCVLHARFTVTTVDILPGSSGGGLFNIDGELVGIASASDNVISDFVRLSDINAFLRDK